MKIAILKESATGETRVAGVPETVAKLVSLGHEVSIESQAGLLAGATDAMYKESGGKIAKNLEITSKDADVILMVQRPNFKQIDHLPMRSCLIALLDPYSSPSDFLEAVNKRKLSTLAMEFVPRITRAQSMDALSSQSNLAGYRAVIEAVHIYGRALPMMMTAAGTVAPAKVFVMGAGVAGLQAIATARRLGAVVSANDVRPAAKEQVASLGAKFIAIEDDEFKQAETAGGYAKAMSEEYQIKQAELTASHIAKQDIVITTALIPGRPAPVLVTKPMVESMAPGSVIVDMAAPQGGNCPLTKPDKIVTCNEVKIAGFMNLPARLPADTSALYAKNLISFLPLITNDSGEINIDKTDEIVSSMLLTQDGTIVNERLTS